MIHMVSNRVQGSDYFHALIEFERDLPFPLPPAATSESAVEALGDLRRVFLGLDAGAAQPSDLQIPSAGGCAREFLSTSLEAI